MEKTIHVHTDMSVKDLLKVLQRIKDAQCHVLKEIDSVNYGLGFEIRIYGVKGRIYDDERSDEAMQDPDFVKNKISWSKAMKRAAKKLKGEVWLKIEIDRWSESKAPIQESVVKAIKNKLAQFKLEVV